MKGNKNGSHRYAAWLGKKGGKKGGPARARKMTEEARRAAARDAAMARWHRREWAARRQRVGAAQAELVR